MGPPPQVGNDQLSETVARIVRRRVKVDDPDRYLLPDDTENPQVREVLDYLQSHSRVPRWVAQADVADALTLMNYLWWQDRRRELAWLRTGIRRGLFLSQLGAQVGIGKQGVKDRLDRLEALLTFDRPDERITRAQRRAAADAEARREAEIAWIADHVDELAAIAAGFTTAADRFHLDDEEREWIDELARDARDQDFTPGSVRVLALAADELRTAPSILELGAGGRPYRVHEWLARADRARSAFAGLGITSGAAGSDR